MEITNLSEQQKSLILTTFFNLDRSINLYEFEHVLIAWEVVRNTMRLGMSLERFFLMSGYLRNPIPPFPAFQAAILNESLRWLDWYGFIVKMCRKDDALFVACTEDSHGTP